MKNGNGGHAANGNGDANGHVESLRPIRYQVLGGGPCVRYSPFSRFPLCPCRETHSYPNDLVLSINDERRQLVITNRTLLEEIEELRAMVEDQGARILELEGTVIDEQVRVEAAHDQVQRTRARLVREVDKVQERAAGILADTTMLIDGVVGGVESSTHEDTSEEEPFKEDPEEEV
nr:uncharacterized protein LOC113737210 [Coffea arabica]